MATKTNIPPQDDVDRLKGIAFWYWEYTRRNPLYIRYCDVINVYDDYFKSLGVYDFMQSKEYLDETSGYVTTHDEPEDLKFTPFRRRLENDFGEEAGKIYFKYGCLGCGFEKHFGRIYKHYSIGINTEEALSKTLVGNNFSFCSENPTDFAALVKLNETWLITIDDFEPSTFSYDVQRAKNISTNPSTVLENPEKLSLEVHALSLIKRAVESLFGEQHVPDETLQAVYKLSIAGRRFNSTDLMRLAMLWLWDKAHEKDAANPALFEEIYPLLKAKITDTGSTLVGNWDQLIQRPGRARDYYAMTDYCIQHHTITHLNK